MGRRYDQVTGFAPSTVLVCAPEVAGMHSNHGRGLVGTPRGGHPLRHSARERPPRAANFPMGFAVATRLGNVDAAFRLREGRPDVRALS